MKNYLYYDDQNLPVKINTIKLKGKFLITRPNIRGVCMKQKENTILKEKKKSEFIFSITEKKEQLQ